MNLGLKDKKVIVTGGANGIGKSVVMALVRERAIPIVLDKDSESLGKLPSRCICFDCNVSDEYAFHKVIATIKSRYNDIYGIVNNAGVNDGVGATAGLQSFLTSLQNNLFHYYQLTGEMISVIAQNKGSIVNISSKVSLTGQGNTSGYAAAKGAINALTREWAVDFAPQGVRVNAIIPAEVATPQYTKWIANDSNADSFLAIKKKINLGKRLTTAKEIAETVVFLLSSKSSHTTGQLLVVDGGYTHLDDARNE